MRVQFGRQRFGSIVLLARSEELIKTAAVTAKYVFICGAGEDKTSVRVAGHALSGSSILSQAVPIPAAWWPGHSHRYYE